MRRLLAGCLLALNLLPAHALTIQAVGDVMLGSNYPDAYYFPQGAAAYLQPALPALRTPGAVNLINLEGTLGGSDADAKECGASALKTCYIFRMPAETAELLKRAPIQVANMANNHSNDFGSNGRTATLQVLRQAGIQPVGQKTAPVAELPAERLRVIGCSFHVGSLHCVNDRAQIEGLIEAGKAAGQRVVMTAHWGGGGDAACPGDTQGRILLWRFARQPLAAGASLD